MRESTADGGSDACDDPRRRFRAIADVVYEPLQRYLARRVAADEVGELLDDVLLVIWRRLGDVPSGDPLPWSYGVARRCVANHRRGTHRRLKLVQRIDAVTPRPGSAVPDTTAAEATLATALAELRDEDRELIRLWAWERLEPREIATVLAMTPNAVSLRLSRARSTLRSSLERQDQASAGHRPDGCGEGGRR